MDVSRVSGNPHSYGASVLRHMLRYTVPQTICSIPFLVYNSFTIWIGHVTTMVTVRFRTNIQCVYTMFMWTITLMGQKTRWFWLSACIILHLRMCATFKLQHCWACCSLSQTPCCTCAIYQTPGKRLISSNAWDPVNYLSIDYMVHTLSVPCGIWSNAIRLLFKLSADSASNQQPSLRLGMWTRSCVRKKHAVTVCSCFVGHQTCTLCTIEWIPHTGN